jgi:hypothetical protein
LRVERPWHGKSDWLLNTPGHPCSDKDVRLDCRPARNRDNNGADAGAIKVVRRLAVVEIWL